MTEVIWLFGKFKYNKKLCALNGNFYLISIGCQKKFPRPWFVLPGTMLFSIKANLYLVLLTWMGKKQYLWLSQVTYNLCWVQYVNLFNDWGRKPLLMFTQPFWNLRILPQNPEGTKLFLENSYFLSPPIHRFCKRKVFISGMVMLQESILTGKSWIYIVKKFIFRFLISNPPGHLF